MSEVPGGGGRRRRLEVEDIGDIAVVNFVDKKILDEQNIQMIGDDLFRLVDELPVVSADLLAARPEDHGDGASTSDDAVRVQVAGQAYALWRDANGIALDGDVIRLPDSHPSALGW